MRHSKLRTGNCLNEIVLVLHPELLTKSCLVSASVRITSLSAGDEESSAMDRYTCG